MNDKVKKDILYILKLAVRSLKKRDSLALGRISNLSIHTAGVFQDDDSISIAVLTYALFKIVQRHEKDKVSFDEFIKILEQAEKELAKNDFKSYRQSIKGLFSDISSTDKRLRFYVQKVIHKAKIQRGSYMHAHGISVARTAELLGISQWQLMDYVGQTKVADVERHKIEVKKRLELARSLFQ